MKTMSIYNDQIIVFKEVNLRRFQTIRDSERVALTPHQQTHGLL